MAGTTFCDIGIELLQIISVEELQKMKCCDEDYEECSLYELVICRLGSARGGKRVQTKENYQKAFEEIAIAFNTYWESLIGPYSYKQAQKLKLYQWLEKIQKEFSLSEPNSMEDLRVKNDEMDPAISIVKLLHSRSGITVGEIAAELGFQWPRAVQKYLRKLSPDLSEEETSEEVYEPCRIGGQPVRVKIQKFRDKKEPKKIRFRTINTMHPIVLQENLMQIATLLMSLSDSYNKDNNEIAFGIALDIWYQLSEYARSKMRGCFAVRNNEFRTFLDCLDYASPKDRKKFYQTEREMVYENNLEMTIEQSIRYLMKAESRRGSITIKTENGEEKQLDNYSIRVFRNDEGEEDIEAIGPNGSRETLERIVAVSLYDN